MFLLPTKDFLDVVETILFKAGKPVSIEDLVKVLVSLEAIDADADFKKQKHDVYSKVWLEPKKHGDAARWQRTGKGMWCHVTHLTGEMLASDAGAIRTLGEKREKARLEGKTPKARRGAAGEVPEEARRCGNCSHLRFFGVHYLNLDAGSCESWPSPEVHAAYVRVVQSACPLWRQRSQGQHEADQREMNNDKLALIKNGVGPRGRAPKATVVAATVHVASSEEEDDDGE